ncbi:amino acid racemase [Undibacterium sp. TS12]|uniref:aspartate/glutamate racemase family protein n=1 Tax=Undibacterium sp. TS12 TaxID=2908202 RepID=UPI001F4D2E43|nr:amino acid racemase [Undibacterium sp. TS12]MCH8620332.1 amino acid racemase [Undibacterium sp. TS12]
MQKKTIGLIGGIGWASSAEYYRLINELTAARLGLAHSARIVLLSLDQYDFTSRAAESDPLAICNFLVTQVHKLKDAGADFFLFCANGAHRFVPAIYPRLPMPFVSIVDATVDKVKASGIEKVGLLGVRQTMAGSFYHDRLRAAGIATLTPDTATQDSIHDIIYNELIHNRLTQRSRALFVEYIQALADKGAQGIILGCTEIPLLIRQEDVALPIFNTTAIHCQAAVDFAFA